MAGGAFAELMALSASQTEQSQSAVQQALQERKRREEAKRSEIELAERREKQRAEKERKQYFEKQKQEAETAKRRAEQEKVAEAARQRRADQARDALLFGPKKAKSLQSGSSSGPASSKWPSSSTGVREDVRKKRAPAEHAGPEPLTREELRERKQQAENRRMLAAATAKRSSGQGTRRAGSRLPGGAVDLMSAPSNNGNDLSAAHKSVRERLAAMPNTLMKLNTVKRDVRTIDEIVQDRANAKAAKTLNGDQARTFDDWFSSTKKKPQPQAPAPKRPASTSEWSTPVVGRASPAIKPKPSTTTAPAKPANTSAKQKPAAGPSKPMNAASSSASAARNGNTKKRSRSPSYSDASPPKRRAVSYDDDEDDYDDGPGAVDVRSMIWGIMGKNRAEYVARDIISDDEDMEADANALEREEKASARLAKREDEIEAERLRRRELEKAKKRQGGR